MAANIKELDVADEEEEDVFCNTVECLDPPNYKAAMKMSQAEKWKTAIESE